MNTSILLSTITHLSKIKTYPTQELNLLKSKLPFTFFNDDDDDENILTNDTHSTLINPIPHDESLLHFLKLMSITEFRNQSRWLSNFHPVNITVDNLTFPSTENAYQAFKTKQENINPSFLTCSPAEAKRLGRSLPLNPHFDKVNFMQFISNLKYQNQDLKELLVNTSPFPIIEGNNWHDNYWGICSCKKCRNTESHNYLGIILMNIRYKLVQQI